MVGNRTEGAGDVNDFPIRTLKPADQPPVPDPQMIGAQHMARLRSNAAAADELVKIIQGWHEDPIGSQRRAFARAIELLEGIDLAVSSGERLMQAKRATGEFSHQFTDDLGISR